jgi:hypothetical protein
VCTTAFSLLVETGDLYKFLHRLALNSDPPNLWLLSNKCFYLLKYFLPQLSLWYLSLFFTSAPGMVPQFWQPHQMFLSGLLDSHSHMSSDSTGPPDARVCHAWEECPHQTELSGTLYLSWLPLGLESLDSSILIIFGGILIFITFWIKIVIWHRS